MTEILKVVHVVLVEISYLYSDEFLIIIQPDINYLSFFCILYLTTTHIKQLLDEVEHNIMNYQNRGLCYLPITQTRGFDNS